MTAGALSTYEKGNRMWRYLTRTLQRCPNTLESDPYLIMFITGERGVKAIVLNGPYIVVTFLATWKYNSAGWEWKQYRQGIPKLSSVHPLCVLRIRCVDVYLVYTICIKTINYVWNFEFHFLQKKDLHLRFGVLRDFTHKWYRAIAGC